MARVYATAADLAAYTGQAAPDGADALLAKASRFLDSSVLRLCWYHHDRETGLPTDPAVVEAVKLATCAQAAWWDALGDSTGAQGAGWASMTVGAVSMSRSQGRTSAADSPAREIAPEVMDVLQSPDLPPWVFRLGAVHTW